MIATVITLVVAFFVSGYVNHHAYALTLWPRFNRVLSPVRCVQVGMLTYVIVVGGVAILRHQSLNSNALDMGLMDQIVWNSAHGRWLEQTFFAGYPTSFLGDHFSPALVLLAPFYWLLPRPETLIIVQIGCIVGSVFLLYRVGVKLTGREWVAASLALMLLLHPLLQDAALFDFHQDAIGMFFLALALYGISYQRWWLALVGWIVSLLSKEELAVYWIVIGLFFLVIDGRWRLPKVVFIVANGFWLYLAVFVFIPFFQPESGTGFVFFNRYAFWGGTIAEVLHTIASKPKEAVVMLLLPNRIGGLGMMLLPVLLFLLRSHWVVLILLIPLGINSLSDLIGQHNYRFHYSMLPIVMITYAAIWAIVILQRKHGTDGIGILSRATLFLTVAALMLFVGVSQLGLRLPGTLSNYWPDHHDQIGFRMMEMIPADASVIAQNKLVAHLSQRPYITVLPRRLAEPTDYFFVDLKSPFLPLTAEEYVAEISAWLTNPDYGVMHMEDGYILLAKGVSRDEANVQAALDMVNGMTQSP